MVRIKAIEKDIKRIRRSLHNRRMDGGPGSGNWGHAGRPGKIGGSEEGNGKHNRKTSGKDLTAISKKRKESMKAHPLGKQEIVTASKSADVIILDGDGKHFTVHDAGKMTFACKETGEIRKFEPGQTAKVLLPSKSKTNHELTRDDKKAMGITTETFTKAEVAETRKDADNRYRSKTSKIWQECTDQQKDALFEYTKFDYEDINGALRTGEADDYYVAQKIQDITEVLDKSVIEKDTVFFRGIEWGGAEKMFGLPEGCLARTDKEDISLVGRIGTDNGFMSCGAARGTGLHDFVDMEILAPAGTKGLYCEPFSAHGFGDRRGWDGKSGQDMISNECEMLLQRGCTVQVIGHEIKKDEKYGIKYHKLKVVIIRQEPGKFKYTGG